MIHNQQSYIQDSFDGPFSEAETEEKEENYKQEQIILNFIFENRIDQLRKMQIHIQNLNYLEEFKQIPIDLKISPLILAAYLGKYDVVKMLLQNETIEVDLGSDDSGFTPLMVSCMAGYYEIVQLLLSYGADVNKTNNNSQIPLLFCFTRLEEETNHFENKRICMKMAETLLQNGSDIDAIVNTEKQYTMLMVFCSVKYKLNQREQTVNKQMIKFLLQNGADPNKISKKKKNCFELAKKHCNRKEIQEILANTKQIYFHEKNMQITVSEKPQKHIACQIDNNNNQSEEEQQQKQCCSILSWFM